MAKRMSRPSDTGPEYNPVLPNVAAVADRLGVDRTSVSRYITRGGRPSRRAGPAAPSIKLAATRLPGGWFVSDDQLRDFQDRLTRAWTVPGGADQIATSAQLTRRAEESRARLIKLGLA